MSAEQAARWSVNRINDRDRAKRVRAVLAEFTANSNELERKARTHQTADILASPPSVTGVSDSELKWLYEAQVAKKGRPAYKEVYQRLLSLATYGLCSYCQYGAADVFSVLLGVRRAPLSLVYAFSRALFRSR